MGLKSFFDPILSRTIGEERIRLKQALRANEKNIVCQGCGTHLTRNYEELTKELVDELQWIHDKSNQGRDFIQVPDEAEQEGDIKTIRRRQYTKLRYWAMIVRKPKTTGFWKTTITGAEFLRNEISVPIGVKVFRGTVIQESDQRIKRKDL